MRFIVVLSLFLMSLSANGQNSEYMQFQNRSIDLGYVKKGAVVDTQFVFTNISSETIEIDIVDACECTTLDWTETEIAPGEQGIISVSFDSGKKEEVEDISVDITLLNTDPNTGGPVMDGVKYSYRFTPKKKQ